MAGTFPFNGENAGDNPPPCNFSINPGAQDACPDQEANLRGGPYTFNFTATGGPFTTYSWTISNDGGTGAGPSNLTNANTATVTLNTMGLGYGTITLRCTVTGGSCGPTSKEVTVTTNPSPNTHLDPQWKCSTTSPGYSATWNLNSEISPLINNGGAWTVKYYTTLALAVAGGAQNVPNVKNVSSASETIYARIENAAGCWLAGPVYLKVWPAPSVNPTATTSTICPGTTTTVNGNPSGGAGGYSHAWVRIGGSVPAGNVSLTNTSSQVATVGASSNGTIILRYTATDANGCTATGNVTVTVSGGTGIAITELPDITVCPASEVAPIELSALPLAVNFNYTWTGGAGAGLPNGSDSGADPEISSFFSTSNEGSWEVTVTASKSGYCPDEETFTITVKDVTPPVFITCPADMTVNNDPDKCGANVNWQPPSATDNCSPFLVNIYQVLPISGKTTGDFFSVGLHTIRYVADDDYGNTAVCEFTIRVRDMQVPDIECPSGIQYLETNNGKCSHTLTGTYLNATATENCALDYLRNDYNGTGTLNGAEFPVGTLPIVVKWTAEDVHGNSATCTFAIIVVDDDEPTVASCPGDKTVRNDDGECGANVWYALPRFNDNCGGAYQPGTLIQGGAPGDFFNVGTTVVEWWYFDPAGNGPAVCNFTITVRDEERPEIDCPGNITIETDGSLYGGNGGAPEADPYISSRGPCGVTMGYTAPVGTDNCPGEVTALQSGFGSGPNFYQYGGVYTESWMVTDDAGNTAECAFTVTVRDPIDPTITCPSNTTVATDPGECDAAVSYAFPYYGDNCPDYTLTLIQGPNSGDEFQLGTTTVRFEVEDAAGNTTTCSFTVTVEDRERPFINNCPSPVIVLSSGNGTGDCSGDIPDMRGDLVVTDNCPGVTKTQIPAPGTDFGYTHGAMRIVEFIVTDAAGNTSSCESKVTLKDDEQPTINCSGLTTTLYVTPPICGHTVSGSDNVNPSFNDNCQGAKRSHDYLAAPNSHTLEGAILPVGNTTVVWTITDAAGNTRTCQVTYEVKDNIDPIFVNCPEDVTLNNDVDKCGAKVFWLDPIAYDDCGVTVEQIVGPAPGGFFPVGTEEVSYRAKDPSGNTTICSWEITIRDMQLPDIQCPSGLQYLGTNRGECSHKVEGSALDATASDNCGITLLENDFNSDYTLHDAVFPKGATVVTWIAKDAANNSRTCTYTVIVVDDDDPTVQKCPSDIVRSNDPNICGARIDYEVLFKDNCDGQNLIGDLIEGYYPNSIFPVGTTTVVWRYVDRASNDFAECLFTVTVNDTQDPVIYCPSKITVNIGGGIYGGFGGWPSANPRIVSSGPCGVTLEYTAPIGWDNCPNPLTVLQSGLGAGPNYYEYGGFYTETYNVIDASGNVASCSFIIEVRDPIEPTITCPANTTVATDPGECDAAVSYSFPYFGDNCPGYTLTQLEGPVSGQEFPLGGTYVAFEVTDDAGNAVICSFTVLVEDRERPFINNCPSPVYATTSSNGTGDCSGAVPDMRGDLVATDNCGVDNIQQIPAPGTPFGFLHGAKRIVEFIVTDDAGNTSSCESKVTLQDNEKPTIYCDNLTNTLYVTPPLCGHKVGPDDNVNPNFSDNCDGATRTHNFAMAPQNHTLEGAVLPVGSTTIIWTITDKAGNTTTCSVTYTVIDNVKPVFVNCPSDVTLNNDPSKCGAAVFWMAPIATDDCGVTVTQIGGPAPGAYLEISDSPYTITYQATDPSGNTAICSWKITIQDREKPDVECPLGLQILGTNEGCTHRVTGNYLDATVTDNCQGTVNLEHNYNIHYDDHTLYDAVFDLGITKVNWLAEDGFGNTALCTVTVVVVDDDDPQVKICPDPIVVENDPGICGAEVEYSVRFRDNCDGDNLTEDMYLVEGLESGSIFPVGTTTVVWRYVDEASNDFAECLFTVTVNDTEKPVITCPTDMTVNIEDFIVLGGDGGVPPANPAILNSGPCGVTLRYTAPVGTDNCPNPLTILTSGLGHGPNYYEYGGVYTEAYKVTDASGNTATCSFKITVLDPVEPTITCPSNTTVDNDAGLCGAYVTYSFPYFGDNCPNYSMTQLEGPNSGEFFIVGTTTVAFEVSDDAGNTVTCSFTVTVRDVEKPVIVTCPADRFVNTSSNGTGDCTGDVPNLVPEVVATDNCGIASITQDPAAGTDFGGAHGDMIFVTITVTDIYGNTQTCKVKLTLHDDENPTIDCSEIPTELNNTFQYCHYFVAGFELNPTYDDNCGPLKLTNSLTGNNTLGGTPLPVGSTTVVWKVTDKAGNMATCSVTYTVIDNEPPVARCQGPVIDAVLDGDGLYQLTVANVNNDSWDNCGPLVRTEISRGGVFGQWVYFSCADVFINNGLIDLILEVEDQHGNISQCTTQVAVYDLNPPVITCPNGVETVTDPGVCTAIVNGIGLQYVYDNCPVTITYEITGATIKSGTDDASGTIFNKGVSVVTYTVTDESGNSAVCWFDVEVYDEENPTIDCSNIANLVRSNNTDECSYTVVGTEFDPASFNDNCPGATITNNYNNSSSLAGAEFPVGTTIVIWTVTDASGNTVTCSSKVKINDTQLPTITCPTANATQFVNDLGQCSKTILDGALDPSFADNCPDAGITHNYVTAPNPWTLAGATFPVGSTNVLWTVTDKAGNTATCSITVVVTDNEAPEFVNCPVTMVMVGNDPDKCSAKVNWSIPVAEDNCDILSIVQTGGPTNGTEVPVSSTPFTVTYKATDIHGNTATCSFQVLVVDTQNPEFDADITMPNDITVQCDAIPTNCVWHGNGNQLICSPLTNNDVHDNCTPSNELVITFTETSTQCSNPAQCCYYSYTITRTWKVTDKAGNMLVHTQVITVVDTTPPVAKCKDITVTLDKFGNATITGQDINNGSTDNCAAPQYLTYQAIPNTFGCNQLGQNNVTLVVTDPCGNSSTCTAVVTVVEGIGKCVPEYDLARSVKCECLNNATTLDNGQFREVIQIWALAGQTWTLTSNQGLYAPNSPAPPGAPIILPTGTALVMGSLDGLDNDGDGTIDEADEMVFYTLKGIHVEGIGYTVTVKNAQGQSLTISNKCYYPTPIFENLDDPFCLSTPPFIIKVGENYGAAGTVTSITVNGVPTNIFNALQLGIGSHKVAATFDAGTAKPFIKVNGQVVFGSDAESLADPGCQQMIMKFVQVVGTPAFVVCNDLLHVSLDADCEEEILPDDVLEGTYFCYDDYKVELDKTPPYGNGPWVPGVVNADDIGKTYAYRVVHLIGGNVCWGNLTVEDKLPPVITCPDDIQILCTESEDDLVLTGTPTWEDCSDVNITRQEDYVQFSCAENSLVFTRIYRTWVATDIWGNATSCVQIIDKLRGKTDQVDFPDDVEFVCNDLPPSLDPSYTGWPSIAGTDITTNGSGACGLSVSYTDEEAAVCPGSYKIIRTWKITDWCTGTTSPISVTWTQYIKVLDAPPTIDFSNFNYDPAHDWYDLSANGVNGQCIASGPLPIAIIDGVCNEVVQIKITTPVGLVQNGGLIPPPGLSVGQHLVTYFVEDECGNITEKTITINVKDDVPPAVACDEFTQVALGANGIALVNASTFDDGSYDNCCLDKFEVRRMNGKCDGTPDDFGPTVEFCCTDINDTVTVVFRAYDCHKNVNDCMVQVFVEDKIKPTCQSPANVTVSCESFDPSLWAYGNATSQDNCCLDTITETRNYNLFDTVCNRGTITRTFRAFDCAGNSSQCSQRIIVDYKQNYYIKFPNDMIVSDCDGTGNFGEPTFFGEDCELLAVSYEDQIFTVVPDACYKIERTWTIINWCKYNPDQPCIEVPNPNPNATTNNPANLPGPVVSNINPDLNPTNPWRATKVSITPGAPQTIYTQYWGDTDGDGDNDEANCYRYKQIIKIIDTEDPIVDDCPASPVEYCDLSANNPDLWNESYWWDNTTESHDLCEGDAPLSITATDSCSGANLVFSYLLFLDTDGDGSMETVVSSNNPPAPGTVRYNNIGSAGSGYNGGTPQVFDGRSVPDNQIYRWALHQTVSGSTRTGYVQWKTLAQMPSPTNPNGLAGIPPQLPYGTHKIKWTVTDGCGNEATCEYEFEVKDCKAPTVVCHDGLSTNIMAVGPNQGMAILWATDFLQYGDDNCTPASKLVYGIRKAGQGTGFPLDPVTGLPITSVSFDCTEIGEQEIELWVMDLAGNADFCQATVDIQDNNGVCTPGDFVTVAGALKTEIGEGLEDASVNLQSAPASVGPTVDITDDQGVYSFANAVPLNADYTVTPTKDDNPLNGVSTYDLVLISKHILGLEPLNSPYKMIAADANKSNSITTFDIVEIRKLILGIYNDLPNNTSWRFVDQDFAFPNPANPFQTQFPEIISVPDVLTHHFNDDFVAVKIGDVNNTAIANSFMSTDDRTSGTLYFDVDERDVKAGETFSVTFRAAEKVHGWQFTMNLAGLEVVSIVENEKVKASNFGVFGDALTTSVDVPSAVAAEMGQFTVTFRAAKSGRLSQMLGVSSRITRAEAYSLSNNRMDVALRFNKEGASVVSGVGFELYQNQPNPFVNKTVIGFHLPEAAEATLTIFDESGRLLFTQKGQFAKGYNAIPVERALLDNIGLMYYKLETATDSATKKMIQTK
jgi:hypothetical protein